MAENEREAALAAAIHAVIQSTVHVDLGDGRTGHHVDAQLLETAVPIALARAREMPPEGRQYAAETVRLLQELVEFARGE